MVVLAHMLEAEPEVFVLTVPTLGRAMRRRITATFPLAARLVGRARAAIFAGLDANAIEQG
jgi:hypothetical protein